ncbi:MAG: DUF2219 family protein [Flavobacteriaceae bacterium]|nr:DUF2219 family protein [Flavobacteriaceae bacterium]
MKRNKQSKINVLLICITFFFNSNSLTSQNKSAYKYALSISTDNDALGLWENFDRYYTYGIGFNFYVKPDKFLGLEKLFSKKENHFIAFGIKSEGYTPTRYNLDFDDIPIDQLPFERPFAGLLFGTLESTYTFNSSFIKLKFLLGVMGPSSYAKDIQDWLHDKLPDSHPLKGWEFQIPNQAIININLLVAHDFFPEATTFDVFAMGQTRLGNLYIDATPTVGFRIGKFLNLNNSSGFNNGLIAPDNAKELYFKSTFSATLSAFNGTAQGNLFGNNFEHAVNELSYFYTSMSHGIFLTGKRYSAGFDNVFTFGKVNKNARHIYGRLNFKYRF